MILSKKNRIRNADPFTIQELPTRDLHLGVDRNLEWVEESVKLEVEENEGENFGNHKTSKEFIGVALSQKRLTIFLFFIFLILGVLFFKAGYLQIIKGNYYRGVAEGNRIRTVPIIAERGVIYDKNLKPLVKNIPTFSLYLIPSDLPKDEEEKNKSIQHLAEVLKINPGEIEKSLADASPYSFAPVLLLENVDYEEAIRLKIESNYLSGIDLELESRREYLKGDNDEIKSLSHILGYTGKINKDELEKNSGYGPTDFIGKTGIEIFYESLLKGKNGKKQVEVDAMGKEKSVIAKEDPVAGKNIVLTLDLDSQKKLEEITNRYLKLNHKSRAATVVLNPQNGEILSMVSLPTFDNNLFAQGIGSSDYQNIINDKNLPLLNRATMGEYPSGSTIKPVIAAAALEEKLINKNTSFLSVGGLRVASWFFPDWKAGGHGLTNVTRAIAESINTFFYIIGGGYEDFSGLGVERIVKYAKFFGLGEKLGIDLPSENDGFLPSKEWKEKTKGEQWYIGDTYHLAIGQGDILVTPLQIAAATAVFGNGGTLYAPHLLEKIDLEEMFEKDYIIRQNFISEENINIVRAGMRQTITSGSGQKLLSLPVTSAGKTGTAQWSTTKSPHAWFTSFAPYENPEIVVTVLVEEGEEGSRIALDIAKEFMMWYFSK